MLIGGGHRGFVDREAEAAVPDARKMGASARTVAEVFLRMHSVSVARSWCGIDGMTPDHLPVIGPSPSAPNNAFHAVGFSSHGLALGPIVGQIVFDLIVDGRPRLPISGFAVDRTGLRCIDSSMDV